MSGAKIIEGLKQAIAGDLQRVTIDGQVWMRAPVKLTDMAPGLGKAHRDSLAAMFGRMYAGWDRGVNMEGPDTGFRETAMTAMELEARYVAAEIGLNIFEISNHAAFAPIIVYETIQKYLGPLFKSEPRPTPPSSPQGA